MAERTVTVCDRRVDNEGAVCGESKAEKCGVCRSDFCLKHRHSHAGFDLRINSGVLHVRIDLGAICQICANTSPTRATEASLKQLLDPHKEEILEILRAQQTAEALK
jgi:hypothetical protein